MWLSLHETNSVYKLNGLQTPLKNSGNKEKKTIWRVQVRKNVSGICIVNHLFDLGFKNLRKEVDMLLPLVFLAWLMA